MLTGSLRVAGRLCEIDIDDCAEDPCENDGRCDDHENGFTCRCLPGFSGELCSDHDLNVINSSCEIEPTECPLSAQVMSCLMRIVTVSTCATSVARMFCTT